MPKAPVLATQDATLLILPVTGKPTLVLYDRATTVASSQSNGIGWVRNPVCPDGRYIVFESGSRGQWDIEVLNRGSNIELDIPNGARWFITDMSP